MAISYCKVYLLYAGFALRLFKETCKKQPFFSLEKNACISYTE